MFLTYLMLAVALSLSAVAAFYSIIGLAAIFAAAVVPIVIMGSILEVAKLTVTVWLHEYWRQCKLTMKAYLVPAVGILMLITSMGIFGFLSKAHLDQAVPAGDISAQVAIFDEKIKTQRDNIDAARNALRQMDAQVDQVLGRSNDEKGAERAVQIRRQQAVERARLQADITKAQAEIVKLNEQRSPIAAQARKVEAEVGPIKYIAALIYGDNPDANLLEKAVRWVIIILVLVFDPLAVMMLLAATESYKWEKARRAENEKEQTNDTVDPVDDTSMDKPAHDVDDRLDQLEPELGEPVEHPRAQPSKLVDAIDDQATNIVPEPMLPVATPEPEFVPDEPEADTLHEDGDDDRIKAAKNLWKHDNPNRTLKEMRRLYDKGLITQLPWEEYLPQVDEKAQIVTKNTMGREPPVDATRGDLFVNISTVPSQVFKYNGTNWVAISKDTSDQYSFNEDYIEYLMEKISKGEYDPELLTDAERSQIEEKIRQDLDAR